MNQKEFIEGVAELLGEASFYLCQNKSINVYDNQLMELLAEAMEKALKQPDKPLPEGFDAKALIAAIREKAKSI
jgi:hypothetical protein